MATLGTMQTRIADELQIDSVTYLTEINRAVFSAIAFYRDDDFWFLETAPTSFVLSLTTNYSLSTVLPGHAEISALQLQMTPGRQPMRYRTLEEMLALDFDDSFTGEPIYYNIHHETLWVLPSPNRTYTAVAYYNARVSMTASASASSVWTNDEAEEIIRLHAEADILENRIKDYDGASRKLVRLDIILNKAREKTASRKSARRLKPNL